MHLRLLLRLKLRSGWKLGRGRGQAFGDGEHGVPCLGGLFWGLGFGGWNFGGPAWSIEGDGLSLSVREVGC